MLPFLRNDLEKFSAYKPHPGESTGAPVVAVDRLDTNENPLDLPVELKTGLANLWETQIESNRYPDGSYSALKAAIAAYVNESAGIDTIASANITIGNGSDELIRSILIATCLTNDVSIAVAAPTFSMYEILATTLGVPTTVLPRYLDTFAIDTQGADRAIAAAAKPVKVIWMVHPNSPTANALTAAEIEWLRGFGDDRLIVIDEAYFEFCQKTLVAEIASHPNWIVLRTFSKAFRLATHRVGYGVGHPEAIAVLDRIRLPYNLPSFTIAAAELALKHRHELLRIVPQIQSERARLYDGLKSHDGLHVWPSDANFLYVRPLPHPGEDAEAKMADIASKLKSLGTLIRHTGGGLRITIGTPAENDRTLARIAAIV
jgi:histidinol-phosphate aminotransferase